MQNHTQPSEIAELLKKGVRQHQAGKLEQAAALYNNILATDPNHSDALHLLGVVAHQSGNYDAAADLITKAIKIDPTQSFYFNNLGNAQKELGNFKEAELCFQNAISLKADYAVAYYGLANTYQLHDNPIKAETYYLKALQIDPDFVEAYFNLGNLYLKQNNGAAAISSFRKAVQKRPDHAEACYGLGNAYRAEGILAEALRWYQKSLDLNIVGVEACTDMGHFFEKNDRLEEALLCFQKIIRSNALPSLSVYMKLGALYGKLERLSDAIFYFQKALDLEPDSAVAYYNLGLAHQKQSSLGSAVSYYQKALRINADYTDAYFNLGVVNHKQGYLNEAADYYKKAIQLKPDYAPVYSNLGLAYQKQNKIDDATQCFEKALKADPDFADALSHLVHQLQHICDWNRLQKLSAKLDGLNKNAISLSKRTPEAPFINLTRHAEPALNWAVAKTWVNDIVSRISSTSIHFPHADRRRDKKKITIGYLSNNFGNHPVAHLMQKLYGLHDRNNFEIICYSYGKNDGYQFRKKIEHDCDKFVDLFYLSDSESAKCINQDQVDILVDLVGHTEENRLSICAYQPAPVQVSYLGFLGSMGADFIDYIITDRLVTPQNHAPYYSEKFVYMPHTYQINNDTAAVSKRGLNKHDFELPENSFVFCSFNKPYKIEPGMFNSWMKILRKVDGSVLWLISGGKAAEMNLRREAKLRGVDAERLYFAEMIALEDHLERLKLADLALDTRVYNGGATTSNALWAGIPVITLQGNHFVSRMSASSLNAIGLPELIVSSLEEYEALAIRLAQNEPELDAIKLKLKKNRLSEPLFDTPRFVKNLENAYRQMWDIYLAGEIPHQINVSETAE